MLNDNAPGGPQTASLTGIGSLLLLAPGSVSFGSVPVGETSAPKNVTLTNVSKSTVQIAGMGVSGSNGKEFAETNNCGASLPGGASCTFSITFTPKSKGFRSATLNVRGGGATNQVALSGQGT